MTKKALFPIRCLFGAVCTLLNSFHSYKQSKIYTKYYKIGRGEATTMRALADFVRGRQALRAAGHHDTAVAATVAGGVAFAQ